jgi:tRNA A-37 threonylcarbamoyl transferase component Bud32
MAPIAPCPQCNNLLNPKSRFCNACGAPVPSSATGATIAARGAPPTPAAKIPSAAQWSVGATIGPRNRYRIERALGQGGFGQTYLATDAGLKQRKCVIKRMLDDPTWSPAERQLARANFVREAELLADLNTPGHPNIPEIYEYLDDEACLVMKYIEGKNFDELGQTIPVPQTLGYIRDICRALVYMHAQSPPVLHRDIKPANLLLGANGHVWLIDFGLSKSTPIQPAASHHLATMMAGTLGYTPPEQWQSAASPQSDVYALAATLHTLLTGHVPPFTIADLPDLISGALGAFPRSRSLNPAVDPRIDALIERSMAFDSAKRPTAAEFLQEIEGVLQPGRVAPAITTPDGQSVATPAELARWCGEHWLEACDWLDGRLPDVVETGFLNAQLAKTIRSARIAHRSDRNAALDAVIELLDPAASRAVSIQVTPQLIRFGGLIAGGPPVARTITVANSGQRYLPLRLQGDSWLRVASPDQNAAVVNLLPGMQQQITIYADIEKQRLGGTLSAQLVISSPDGLKESFKAVGTIPRWKTFWLKLFVPAFTGMFMFLFGFLGSMVEGLAGKGRRSSRPSSSGPSSPSRKTGKNKNSSLFGSLLVFFMIYSCFAIMSNRSIDRPGPTTEPSYQNNPLPIDANPTAGQPPTTSAPTESQSAAPAEPEPQKARISGVLSLNIRAEPDAGSKDIGDLYDSTVFELTGEQENGWYRIRAGAIEGWVNGRYVEVLP